LPRGPASTLCRSPHDRTRRTLTVLADLDTVRIVENNEVLATTVARGTAVSRSRYPSTYNRLSPRRSGLGHIADWTAWRRLCPAARASRAPSTSATKYRQQHVPTSLRLLDSVGAEALEDALVEVLEHDAIHIGAVRQVLDRRRSDRGLPPPVTIPLAPGEHRDLVITPHALSTYDALKKGGDRDH
jgi:hypothetical protein